MSDNNLKNEEISNYINLCYINSAMRYLIDQLLYCLKTKQEMYPSESNYKEWVEFSAWVLRQKNEEK